MQYAKLGGSGLVVSRLAFGALAFGEAAGGGEAAYVHKVAQDEADALVGYAIDQGVNFFNTADVYAAGQSEAMLGKALGSRRQDVVIATKAGHRVGLNVLSAGLSRRHLISSAESSLRRLGTDWIDLFIVHRFDPFTPVEETLSALDYLCRSGKVRYVGCSNWPAWATAHAITLQYNKGYEPFRAAEVYYSLIGRDIEAEIMPQSQAMDVGLMIWSPLAGGYLSGRYTEQDPTGGNGRLAGHALIPFDPVRASAVVDALKQIAAQRDATPAQVALAWILTKPVATVIVGSSRRSQLAENLAAIDLRLDSTEIATLEGLTETPPSYPNWFIKMAFDRTLAAAIDDGRP